MSESALPTKRGSEGQTGRWAVVPCHTLGLQDLLVWIQECRPSVCPALLVRGHRDEYDFLGSSHTGKDHDGGGHMAWWECPVWYGIVGMPRMHP